MSSPQSTTSHEAEGQAKKNLEQITFRFCAECSNMLYPKEDQDSHKLQFTCRTCQYTEEAASTCVFRNVMNNAAGETAGVTQDVGSDPTVGVSSVCSVSSTLPSAPVSTSLSPKAVLCLCCGTLLACRSCGELFCRSSPPSTATSLSTATTPSEPLFSPALHDADDVDLDLGIEDVADAADMALADLFCRGGSGGGLDLAGFSDDNDYEFMDGTECGNR